MMNLAFKKINSSDLLANPNARCVRDDRHGWISRDQLRGQVEELRARILDLEGGLIFLFGRNDVSTLIGLLAGWAARQPVALIDPDLPRDALARLVETYRPEILLGAGWSNVGYDIFSLQGELTPAAHVSSQRSQEPIHPDLALLLSTSGSTGSPKFVRLSFDAVSANARQISEALAITPEDIGIAHLPLHYSYGLSIITSHLVSGAAVSLMNGKVTELTFWRQIGDDGGTHFPGVPFHYTVLDRLGIKRLAPASITTFTQAGGHLDHQTRLRCYEAISARGGRFYVMYGQTEAGPRMTTLQSDEFPDHSTSVGRALRDGLLSILGEEGSPEAPGVEGHVVYHGPNVMMGYATSRSGLSVPDLLGGRLETGDRGFLSADGFLDSDGSYSTVRQNRRSAHRARRGRSLFSQVPVQ